MKEADDPLVEVYDIVSDENFPERIASIGAEEEVVLVHPV